ncbi:hypothetical protein Pint_29515 [Pistacia integerrima]|uniref:Uncharacterized protein n=1 Tax=Pistacia integerrima TaxID=434235 RepID=A0ACC0X397_9ROSI|nr:hypothetical protein Pint_29515 [Pistacia integerrima]
MILTKLPIKLVLTLLSVAGKAEILLENQYDSSESKNRQYAYSDVIRITNNFTRVLGNGGFGTVYDGCIGDNEVAVKMLSPSSAQGYKEFHAEVSVKHSKTFNESSSQNLTALVGYCIDGKNMGLIYEYMPMGTLEQHLSGKTEYILSWEERMRIAVDAAQG